MNKVKSDVIVCPFRIGQSTHSLMAAILDDIAVDRNAVCCVKENCAWWAGNSCCMNRKLTIVSGDSLRERELAHKEGYIAKQQGVTKDCNPHAGGTNLSHHWNLGYDDDGVRYRGQNL